MNIALFNDLHKLVNSLSPFDIDEQDFFFFLLGGYYDEELYDIRDIPKYLSECKAQPSKTLDSLLGRKYKKTLELHFNGKLTLEDLIETNYARSSDLFIKTKKALLEDEESIIKLYEQYSISRNENEKIERSLLRLFTMCIVEQKSQLFASCKYQNLKPSTINSILGRDNDAENLRSLLKQYHKIIISGQYGTGKTYFIKYCLSKWNLDDYYVIYYQTDIQSTLSKITYRDINGYEYKDASDNSLFNENYSSALLIIDNMYYSPDFSKELAYLADMKIDIIIITSNLSVSDTGCFYHYNIPLLPDDILYKIFESNSGLSLKDKKQKEMLSKSTLHNVLLVSLIAYHCRKLNDPANKCITDDPIDSILTELTNLNDHVDAESSVNTAFKHPYDKSTLDLLGHVKRIYRSIKKRFQDADFDVTMRQLCWFGCSPIPRIFIRTVLPACKLHKLDELSQLGLITLTEETVQLSSLISNSIFTSEVSPAEYDPLVESISKFLREYERTLDIPYLEDILFTFFTSLYERVKEKNNPKQTKTADRFETWQELAYLIIAYYNQNGDLELAQKVNDMIKYPASLVNAHNAFDKQLIDTSNRMQMYSEANNMISIIDDLLNDLNNFKSLDDDPDITNNLYLSSAIYMTSIISNALDITLNQICLLLLEQYIHPENTYALITHTFVFGRLLQIIDSNRLCNLSHISDEQLSFYHGCSWLINKQAISQNDFVESLNIIHSWDNINYRIRGLAFIIFGESHIAYETHDTDLFMNSILPNINDLKQLIHARSLIPAQTFRQCLYAYIEAAIVQNVFIQREKLDILKDHNFFSHETFCDLFNRCNLTKNDLETLLEHMDSSFSSMESILK